MKYAPCGPFDTLSLSLSLSLAFSLSLSLSLIRSISTLGSTRIYLLQFRFHMRMSLYRYIAISLYCRIVSRISHMGITGHQLTEGN